MNPRHLSRGEFLSLTSLMAGSSLLPRPADAAPKPYVASAAMRLDDVLGQVGEGLAGLDDAQAVRAFLRLLEPA